MWIKTKARFRSGISDVEWDMYSDEQKRDNCEPRDFRFNTDDIMYYNTSLDGQTTIHFRHYSDSITVEMTTAQLDQFIF
jgi:hypothetical protein